MILLILDLDETLIHARDDALSEPPHFVVGPYHVYRRPYLEEFITFCRTHFRVAVWTASSADYADEVITKVFGADYPLEFVWSRKRCTPWVNPLTNRYEWRKNLNKVKRIGYRLEHVLVVDDTPAKLDKHYGNLVRVTSFEGDSADTELRRLMPYLHSLNHETNVRNIEKRYWYDSK